MSSWRPFWRTVPATHVEVMMLNNPMLPRFLSTEEVQAALTPDKRHWQLLIEPPVEPDNPEYATRVRRYRLLDDRGQVHSEGSAPSLVMNDLLAAIARPFLTHPTIVIEPVFVAQIESLAGLVASVPQRPRTNVRRFETPVEEVKLNLA